LFGAVFAMQNYRKLRVWRKAFALALNVRSATTQFPRTGYAELKAQIVSAVESIMFNIVEGCGASTPREFARFLEIAIKSSIELEAQLELARAYKVLREATWNMLSPETIDTRRMLIGLRKKILQTTLSESAVQRTANRRVTPNEERDQRSASDGFTNREERAQRSASDGAPTAGQRLLSPTPETQSPPWPSSRAPRDA
jgi:four helix bundle protein